MTRTPPKPIPVSIVTGFLGSGKTTLLNRILKDDTMAGSAVIVNEFGDVGLDHLFIDGGDEGIIELAAGCLCCTIRGDLVRTLEDLLRAFDNKRIDRLDRIVIETTGLADPVPVLQAIMQHPYLVLRYRLDGVITLVDAVNGLATLQNHKEAVRQVAMADHLIVTKTDMSQGEAQKPQLLETLRSLNPSAVQSIADDTKPVAGELIHCGLYNPETKTPDVKKWLAEDSHHEHKHHHSHDHHEHEHDSRNHHHHDVNRHSDTIRSFSLSTDQALTPQALEMFLDLLQSAHGPKLLRVKGIIKLSDDLDKPVLIHAVQTVQHPLLRLEQWPDKDTRTRIVFITENLSKEYVQKLFDALLNKPSIDTPDRAALIDNPLAVHGM
jgi:G3E family GTPase